MKIVHVIPALTKGGAERVVVDLANDAVERGHSVTILSAVPAAPGLLPRPLSPAVELRYISSAGRSRRAAYARMLPWVVRNREWLFSQDVIHCHLTAASVLGSLIQRMRRLSRRRSPVVVETYHAVGMAISGRQRAAHATLLSGRDVVAFMAEDSYWKRFREARPKGLFRTIPNGIVPLPAINTAASANFRRARTRIPDWAMVVGSIGRLVPARRPDMLLQAFIRLSRAMQGETHLLLAGEGPEEAKLLAEARAHGVADRVHLPGLVLNPGEPLGLIDLYLTVNVGATTGIAALEAAFAGVPVIALQLQPDYRDGASDWIPSFPDPDSLSDRIAQLLGNAPALKELAASQQAYARANHGIEAMAHAYEALYEEAIARATPVRKPKP